MTTVETAIERHDRTWREEREQAERLRSDNPAQDHWKPTAPAFRPAVEEQDPAVNVLAQWVRQDARVIDVGAGGGRIAVPLARHVRELVAVEPSQSMREVLAQTARAEGAHNIEIVGATWEDAHVSPAELVFAAHVTYSVQRIEPFLHKMDRMATRRVALVTFSDPAQQLFAPFWKFVYGEERLRLPTRAELIDMLHQLDIDPQVDPLPLRTPGSFGTPDEAFELVRRRLFVGERTPAETRLHDAMTSLTEVRDGDVWPVRSAPNEMSILSWQPGRR